MADLLQVGVALVAFDKMSGVIGTACGRSVEHFSKLQDKLKVLSERLAEVGTVSKLAGDALLHNMQKPIAAFADLEDAATHLKSTLMVDGGGIPRIFDAIDREAMDLGNRLPGTTADFYNMASALNALGVSGEAIAGGVLRSAAYLGVVLKIPYQQAAEYAAKFKEALGVPEGEMISFMDIIQRSAHRGVKVEEMKYAFSKASGTLKPLDIQGLQAAKELSPLIGMFIKMGRSGEEVGTGLGNIINAVMDMKKVGEINGLLRQYGIELDFVDRATGKFKGITNLIVQFDKLKGLSDVAKTALFTKLLGTGGDAGLAKIIASEGITGYNKMVDAMARQADLQKRVALSLGTLRNVWDAFTGTLQNTFAIMGESAAPTLKRLADLLNALSGRIGDFAKEHPLLTKGIVLFLGAVGGALTLFGTVGIALAVLTRFLGHASGGFVKFGGAVSKVIPWIRLQKAEMLHLIRAHTIMQSIQYHGGFWRSMQFWLYTTKLRILENIGILKAWTLAQLSAFRAGFLTVSGLKSMAQAFGGALLSGIRAAIIGIRALSAAVMANPLGIVLALSALLVYTYWKPISAFFKGLWEGIKEGVRPLIKVFRPLFAAAGPLLAAFKPVVGFIKQLFIPLEVGEKTMSRVAGIGKILGLVLSTAFTAPVHAVTGFLSLIRGLFRFIADSIKAIATLDLGVVGAKIVSTLVQGIKRKIAAPVEAIKGLVAEMRSYLPFSPAKQGPFRDLHRVRIVETIAASLRPAPAVTAMQTVMQKTRAVVEPTTAGRRIGAAMPKAVPAGRGNAMVLHYSPTITMPAGTSAKDKEDLLSLLRSHAEELRKIVEGAQLRHARADY